MKVAWSDLKRNFFAEKPKDVDGVANASALYYREFLLKKIFSVFEFTIPDTWSMDYFQTRLFVDGYIGIVDTDAGVLPLRCSFSGINVFEEPTDIIVANPVLGSFDRKIGVNGVLLRIQYNYQGVLTMLNRYATLLAMHLNIINSMLFCVNELFRLFLQKTSVNGLFIFPITPKPLRGRRICFLL